MNYLIRTIGFGMVQTAAGVVIAFWIEVAHARFKFEHPDGQGSALSNLCWNYSWWYLAVVALLLISLVISARRKWSSAYSFTTSVGYTLLVLWFGFALIAMELCQIPYVNLRGVHY